MTQTSLAQRIKAEFDAHLQRQKRAEEEHARESHERDQRLGQFIRTCDDLQTGWRASVEEFASQFGDKIRVTPSLMPSLREVKVVFLTDLASITLTLSASPSEDVRKLVIDYDLLILPIFFEYDRHARLEMPLDRIDREALDRWVEDRLISCVKAYLSIQNNEFYLKRATVQDPITKARFLRGDAAATLDHNGQTLYFSSQDTLRQYKEKLGAGAVDKGDRD
jgi:YHS domain-containing protein